MLYYRRGGDFILRLEIMLLVGNVIGRRVVIAIHEVMCDVRQRAKRKPVDLRREGNSLPGEMRLPRGDSQCCGPERDQTSLR